MLVNLLCEILVDTEQCPGDKYYVRHRHPRSTSPKPIGERYLRKQETLVDLHDTKSKQTFTNYDKNDGHLQTNFIAV